MSTDNYQEDGRRLSLRLVIILVSLILGGMIIGAIIQFIYFALFGIDPTQLFYREDYRMHLKFALFTTQLTTFLLPALFFGWLAFKKKIWSFFKLDQVPKWGWMAVSMVMLVFLLPLIQYTYDFNRALPLPEWMTSMEENAADTLQAIITMDNFGQLLINLFLIALIPALGEEFLFRGAVQQLGYRLWNNKNLSVWVTAFIFSAIHFQFEGFIPRFILGLYLGYLFLWTNNLIIPIIAHFFNNGSMVIMSYLNPELISNMDETPVPDLPWYGVVMSTICIIPMIYYFRNISRPSPLPDHDEI